MNLSASDHNDYAHAMLSEPRHYTRADLADMLATTAGAWMREGDANLLRDGDQWGVAHRWTWPEIMWAQRLAFQHGDDFALARMNGAPFEWRAAA